MQSGCDRVGLASSNPPEGRGPGFSYLGGTPTALRAYPWHSSRERERYFWAAFYGVLRGRDMRWFYAWKPARKEELIREFVNE